MSSRKHISYILIAVILTLLFPVTTLGRPLLRSKKDILIKTGLPYSVAVDSKGLVYVLCAEEGLIDIYQPTGQYLRTLGATDTKHSQPLFPDKVQPIDLWVNTKQALLLVRDKDNSAARWVLKFQGNHFYLLPLSGCPDCLQDDCTLAAGNNNSVWIVSKLRQSAYYFKQSKKSFRFSHKIALSLDNQPAALDVDAKSNLYILDDSILKVYSSKGKFKYELPETSCFYLNPQGILTVAGPKGIKRFSSRGTLTLNVTNLPEQDEQVPLSVSCNSKQEIFVYFRSPLTGAGTIIKLDREGYPVFRFPQPPRFPRRPGYRLDAQGRLYYWDESTSALVKQHPGGKVESSLSYRKTSPKTSRLSHPHDLAISPDDILWIADSANFRLAKFDISHKRWLPPIPIGIKGEALQAEPRQICFAPDKTFYCIVYPTNPQGEIVIHHRAPTGQLLAQKAVGPARGDPIYNLSVNSQGEIFLYRHGGVPGSDSYVDYPELYKYTPTGKLLFKVGGEAQDFNLPGDFQNRIMFSPYTKMLPWKGNLLIPVDDLVLQVNPRLTITSVYHLFQRKNRPGGDRDPQFTGATIYKNRLYVCDSANRSLHIIPLP